MASAWNQVEIDDCRPLCLGTRLLAIELANGRTLFAIVSKASRDKSKKAAARRIAKTSRFAVTSLEFLDDCAHEFRHLIACRKKVRIV